MALTDTKIRNTKPSKKPIKLFDGGGLFLLVSPAGGKWWRANGSPSFRPDGLPLTKTRLFAGSSGTSFRGSGHGRYAK